MLARTETEYESFLTWNGTKLEEQRQPNRHVATVNWPDGTTEVVDFFIETEYVGYNEEPHQHAFLSIEHHGFVGFMDLPDEHFDMIINIEMITYT